MNSTYYNMDTIDRALKEVGASAYVIYASSEDANMFYLTGFKTGDPVFYLKCPGNPATLIVPQMEYERAVSESHCEVMTRGDAGYFEIFEEECDPLRAGAKMICAQAGGDLLVPGTFPLVLAREMESFCNIYVDKTTVKNMRAVKKPHEIKAIKSVQRAAEGAMDIAVSMIKKAEPRGSVLYYDSEPLTSDIVRAEMQCYLLRLGCTAADTIVSCGPETAMPHNKGNGALLMDEPIVIDVFPRSEKTGYHADMTRTFVRGEPSCEIEDIYNTVKEAKALGWSLIRPGVSGSEVHQAVLDFFTDAGYKTGTGGFMHSLGHGVGLDIHENPALSPSGGELTEGHVITVEPGLYYQAIGGVRLEDLGTVTEDGFDCFTKYKEEIRI